MMAITNVISNGLGNPEGVALMDSAVQNRPDIDLDRSSLQQQGKESGLINRQSTEKTASAMHGYMDFRNIRLDWEIQNSSGRTVVKIINEETEEIIKEIPLWKFPISAAIHGKMTGELLDMRA